MGPLMRTARLNNSADVNNTERNINYEVLIVTADERYWPESLTLSLFPLLSLDYATGVPRGEKALGYVSTLVL